jgi:hypothetical protein
VIPYNERVDILKVYEEFILQNSESIPNLRNKLSEIMQVLSSDAQQGEGMYNNFLEQKTIIDTYASENNFIVS